MGVSEKRSLRYVVGPMSIQMNTCGGFLCHAEAQKKHQYFHVSPSPQIVWDQTVTSPPARVGVPLTRKKMSVLLCVISNIYLPGKFIHD